MPPSPTLSIQDVTPNLLSECREFLLQSEEYALFLLNNLEVYGLTLTDEPFSGNYKLLRCNEKIVGIFCLTRSGTLLIQLEEDSPHEKALFELVRRSCQKEPIAIEGAIGNWRVASKIWIYLHRYYAKQLSCSANRDDNSPLQESDIEGKEILYCCHLDRDYARDPRVRYLIDSDYDNWLELYRSYLEEQDLCEVMSDEQLYRDYSRKAAKNIVWGLFIDQQLIACAELNSQALDLGQVGGVFTRADYRCQGMAKTLMRHLLMDAKEHHQLRKIIIFTSVNNLPAQRVYQSLGVEKVGEYALIFGQLPR